jgi:hypothetical protein
LGFLRYATSKFHFVQRRCRIQVEKVTKDPSRRKYFQEWKAKSLGNGEVIDTHAFLSKEAHARVVELATERKERLPVVIGRLAMLALDILDGGSAVDKLEKMKQPVEPETLKVNNPQSTWVADITHAILASRFPQDTMSARFRQVSLINIFAAETARGNTTTANVIAAITDGEAGQIRLLARILSKRGILSMQGVAGVGSGTYAKILVIRQDALEAFAKVHLDETGIPLASYP